MTARDRRDFALAVCVALTPACGAAFEAAGPSITCAFDTDCSSAQVCMNGFCVDEPTASTRGKLAFEITPPVGTEDLTVTQFLDVDLAAASATNLQFALPRAAIFESAVVLDADGETPVSARITIAGKERIQNREIDQRLTVGPTAQGTPADSAFRLLPGTYRALVLPLSGDRPGLEVRDWVIADAKRSLRKEFQLPTDPRLLSGKVTYRTAEANPVANATVQAVSVPSGLPSTVAVTDELGHYEVALPETEETAFLISAERNGAQGPVWSFEQVVTVDPEETRSFDIGLENVSQRQIGRAHLSVLGLGPQGVDPVPVAGAKVTLTATTALPTRVFRLAGTTDESGALLVPENAGDDFDVIAAKYLVTVEPPPDSDFAYTSTVVDLTRVSPANRIDKQLPLFQRTLLVGTVLAPNGEPLKDVSIEADLLDREQRFITALTDEEGRFEAPMDPGRYLLRIIAPTQPGGTSLPTALSVIDVPAGKRDAKTRPTLFQPPIQVPSGRLVSGRVLVSETRVVADAKVSLFVEVDSRTISLGSAFTDESGAFSLVISDVTLPED